MPTSLSSARPLLLEARSSEREIEWQLNPPAWTPAVETFTVPPAGPGRAVVIPLWMPLALAALPLWLARRRGEKD